MLQPVQIRKFLNVTGLVANVLMDLHAILDLQVVSVQMADHSVIALHITQY